MKLVNKKIIRELELNLEANDFINDINLRDFKSKKQGGYGDKKNLNNKNLINFNLSLIAWNSNGGGLDNDKNLPKRLLLKGLFPYIIFLTEPWVEFDFKNQSYISFTADPVNEKISTQLLVREKFTSKKYPKCHADNVGVELILEKSIIYLIATYIHPSNKTRRKATLIN